MVLHSQHVSPTAQIFQGIAPSFIGNFSDSYGRRPAYVVCCVIYLAANIGLGLQDSYAALLILRCLQSCGSSATIALGSATAADMVTRAERGRYLGYASLGVTLGPALGPVIGGLLENYLGWRSIFWFLAILSGVLFLLVFAVLPETCRSVVGNGSIAPPWYSMSLLAYVRQTRGSKTDQGTALGSAEAPPRRKRPNPFAALVMFADRSTGIVLGFGSLMYGGYYMVLTTLSTELTARFGYSSIVVGLCFLPMGLGTILYRHTGGWLMDWNFRRHMKMAGLELDKSRQQRLEVLPIERMRIEVSLPLLYLSCGMIVAYGWIMDRRLGLPGILISLFFMSLFFSGALNNLNTLIVDLHASSPATAVAANNLARCLVGAGAAAVGTPMIDKIGMGWTSVFVAGVWAAATPLLWLLAVRGQTWRAETEAKAQTAAT
jgi:multidrug resistance protein